MNIPNPQPKLEEQLRGLISVSLAPQFLALRSLGGSLLWLAAMPVPMRQVQRRMHGAAGLESHDERFHLSYPSVHFNGYHGAESVLEADPNTAFPPVTTFTFVSPPCKISLPKSRPFKYTPRPCRSR